VIVAVSMTVFVGVAALVLDMARLYTFKNQLKTIADAAALSAATDLKLGQSESDAIDRAIALRPNNRVGGQLADVELADFEPGRWVIGNPGSFVPTSWSSATAVRITARHRPTLSLGRALGGASQELAETSVAALGSYVSSACVAPFAVPYTAIVAAIGPAKTQPYDELSPSDLQYLASSDSVLLEMFDHLGRDRAFAFVTRNDSEGRERNIAQMLRDAIDGCTTGTFVSVGDELTRNNSAPDRERPLDWRRMRSNEASWYDLCGGSLSGQLNDCTRTLQIPIVEAPPLDAPDPGRYRVRYIGALELARIDIVDRSLTPRPNIRGRLTIDTRGGGTGYTPYAGPVSAIALVQ
jgi:hypothetical protein